MLQIQPTSPDSEQTCEPGEQPAQTEARAQRGTAASSNMGNIVIKIPHITWRDGRPRFSPGPGLRKLGFKGEDIRHGAYGPWFNLVETIEKSKQISIQVGLARQGIDKKPTFRQPQKIYALANLVADVFAMPIFHGKADHQGRRHRKPLSAETVKDYHASARIIEQDHINIWASPPANISAKIASGLIDQIEQQRGLSQARKVRSLLSMTYKRSRQDFNPFSGIELPQLFSKPKDITPRHISHLIEVADTMGRPEIGDMIYVGIFTGQRQKERFQLTAKQITPQAGERLVFIQSKTGAVVSLNPVLMQHLIKRLEQARTRRAAHKVLWSHIVIDEHTQAPWNKDLSHYRTVWRAIVAEAAKEHSILTGFQDQQLRKVAMTWMHAASATDSEAAAVSGHSDSSMSAMKKHYVHKNAEMADNAHTKLNVYLANKEVKL